MRRFLLALALAVAPVAVAPVAVAQPGIPLTAGIGVPGSAPTLCSADVIFTADADLMLTANQYACNSLNVTSTVSLTATRNLIAPLTKGQQFTIMNGTTGGQSIVIKGATGAGVTVPTMSSIIVNNPTGAGYLAASSLVSGIVAVVNGGTGSNTASGARTNLGLGSVPLGFPTGNPSADSYWKIDNSGNITYVNGVQPFCAGITCPYGNQYNTGFTTTTSLTLSAALTNSATSVSVISTSGWPSVGCGVFSSTLESFCWSGSTSTTLTGLTRGVYGSAAISHLAGDIVIGYTVTYSRSFSSPPQFATVNINIPPFYGSILGNSSGVSFASGIIANGNISGPSIGLTGAVGLLGNIQTDGVFGVPPIVYAPARITGRTTPISTPISATCASSICPPGIYELRYYMNTTTAGTAGNATFTITWNDPSAQTKTSTATLDLANAGPGGYIKGSEVIYTSGAANIQYSTAVTGSTGYQYALSVNMTRLQ